jgi:3-methyladenine DNA glycosylase/8-oxoguanine DNA glycosylase
LIRELGVEPRGPYSLALSARLASDATRTFRDGVFTTLVDGALVHAWQSPSGTVTLRGPVAASERLRWLLALDDDHSGFLASVRDDPLLARTARELRGLRPMRSGSVAQALLRALCGQLIEARRARQIERRVMKAAVPTGAGGLLPSPTCAELGRFSASELRALGLHARRAAALVRICRTLELERLHTVPTAAVVARLEREPCLGPWSLGVICLHGLGRYDCGLVGDLGLIKLVRALRGGSRVEAAETAALLAPYGEWQGIASVYLLAGFARGLVPHDAGGVVATAA